MRIWKSGLDSWTFEQRGRNSQRGSRTVVRESQWDEEFNDQSQAFSNIEKYESRPTSRSPSQCERPFSCWPPISGKNRKKPQAGLAHTRVQHRPLFATIGTPELCDWNDSGRNCRVWELLGRAFPKAHRQLSPWRDVSPNLTSLTPPNSTSFTLIVPAFLRLSTSVEQHHRCHNADIWRCTAEAPERKRRRTTFTRPTRPCGFAH